GDPAAGGGGGGGAPPPAGPDPFITGQAAGPIDSYKWSVGGEIGVLGNLGMGESPAGDRLYGPGGANLRLFANFIINEEQRLGVQGYLGFAGLPPTDENEFDQGLAMADIGGALFMHRPLTGHIYWTPLIGAHLAIQQPQELSQGFLAIGARAEVGFSYVFGPQGEHALSINPGLNLYFPAGGEIDGVDPDEYGFDRTRGTFAINAGYTFRFSTPFGSTPLITLE
ncbi:MAG TPA: hypothetical protein VKZ63_04890, partial [Kofleriaceae bacterium]|nr:hypothetical protein [Kofleriaceae bacterium]